MGGISFYKGIFKRGGTQLLWQQQIRTILLLIKTSESCFKQEQYTNHVFLNERQFFNKSKYRNPFKFISLTVQLTHFSKLQFIINRKINNRMTKKRK